MSELNELKGKEVATLLTPTAVTLVTSRDAQGDCVATVAWVQSISHDPSMVVVALRPGGRTAQAIIEGGCFVVNVLPASEEGIKMAVACGKKGPGQPERFESAGMSKVQASCVGAVRVEQAVSWIECELEDHRVYGDHELYVGRTVCAQTSADVDEDGKLITPPVLLMGQRGRFGSFVED